jgi:hypothetical protein
VRTRERLAVERGSRASRPAATRPVKSAALAWAAWWAMWLGLIISRSWGIGCEMQLALRRPFAHRATAPIWALGVPA